MVKSSGLGLHNPGGNLERLRVRIKMGITTILVKVG